MANSSNLTIYKASAGSGKTFRLAVSYIAMLVRNPQSYRGILAVTFTNKATAEMKNRILSQLYGIGHGLPSSLSYMKEVQALHPDMTENEIKCNALRAMELILQNYSHFRVETIDSFFQTVLRSLARELQLGAGLNIDLDTDKAVSDAVDAFLDGLDPKSEECRQVMRFIEDRIDDDKSWDIADSLKAFSKELFNENFIAGIDRLKVKLSNPNAMEQYRKKLQEERARRLEPMKGMTVADGESILQVLASNGLSVSDLSGKIKPAVSKIISGEILQVEKDKLSQTYWKCCTDGSAFFNKDFLKHRPEMETVAGNELSPILQRVADRMGQYQRDLHSFDAAVKYLHELSLLMSVRGQIDTMGREQNRFLLADTPRLLSDLKTGDTSFVFEKTGSFLKNVMIDEFQDTSRLQWSNLLLLLWDCLAEEHDCLVVGDVKQSIYRWRNSDWNILNRELCHSLAQYSPHVEHMQSNFRSLRSVIEFNNAVFPKVAENIQQYLQQLTGTGYPDLDSAYADVNQEVRRDQAQGYVSFESYIPGDDQTDDACRRIADSIDSLLSAGVQQSDIALLFRNNTEILSVAGWFDANRPDLHMVSAEAFRICASASVRILVNALRWIADRGDRVSLAGLLWEWRHHVMNDDTPIQTILQGDLESCLPDGMAGQWEQLRAIPLFELTETLYRLLQLERIPGQDQYVMSFMDTVGQWVHRSVGHASEFISDWDDKLYKNPIPAGDSGGIRLLTIHKSKGLEFHTVIIPFCDWELTRSNNRLWVETAEQPFGEMPLLPVEFVNSLKNSVFEGDFALEACQQAVDNLNILYVAFTRAACNLIVMARSDSKNNPNSVRGMVEKGLADMGAQCDATGVRYVSGTVCPHLEEKRSQQDNPFEIVPSSVKCSKCSHKLTAQFLQSGDSVRFAASTMNDDDRSDTYIERGKLLHNMLSMVRTEADISREADAMLHDGLLDSTEQAERLKREISAHISDSGVQEWFDGTARLFNENAILFRNGKVTQNRRPDRVMVFPDGRTVVVDFKFAKPKEEHHHQVSEYMDLLRAMGMENVSGFVWYVDRNAVEKV